MRLFVYAFVCFLKVKNDDDDESRMTTVSARIFPLNFRRASERETKLTTDVSRAEKYRTQREDEREQNRSKWAAFSCCFVLFCFGISRADSNRMCSLARTTVSER